jgi:Nucleotidyltransferase domain
MQATSYPDINILLDILLSRIQSILDKKLVGLYLNGSLVIGDFDPNISDIDLVAALSSDIDEREFEELQKMHTAFAHEHKEWDDRIEVC